MARPAGLSFAATLATLAPKSNAAVRLIYEQAGRSTQAVLDKRPPLSASEVPALAALMAEARRVHALKPSARPFTFTHQGGRFRALVFKSGQIEVRTRGGLPLTLGLAEPSTTKESHD